MPRDPERLTRITTTLLGIWLTVVDVATITALVLAHALLLPRVAQVYTDFDADLPSLTSWVMSVSVGWMLLGGLLVTVGMVLNHLLVRPLGLRFGIDAAVSVLILLATSVWILAVGWPLVSLMSL